MAHEMSIAPDLARSADLVVLVVGNLRSWRLAGRVVPTMPGFHFVGFQDISGCLLHELHPDIVVSALMGEDFDAVDLARLLTDLAFRGRYRALTNGLPDPQAVRREVCAAAPGIDFDLFILPAGGPDQA